LGCGLRPLARAVGCTYGCGYTTNSTLFWMHS
jgi:hypothetical protein